MNKHLQSVDQDKAKVEIFNDQMKIVWSSELFGIEIAEASVVTDIAQNYS